MRKVTIAKQLADFLTGIEAGDLPAQTLDYAAMLVASTLASAAYGSGLDSTRIIRELARDRGGKPEASIWFDRGEKLPIPDVAQANALASDAAASDDSDLRNILHPGTQLAATTLAIAERDHTSGEDVLCAIVVGYEAAGRLGEAVTPGLREIGFHGCHASVFASAVAAARLWGFDATRTAQAIALAATSIGGLQAAAETSVAREYHAGLAALLGINAARAAGRGYTIDEAILETRQGFFEVYGGVDGTEGGAIAVRDLGTSWDIVTDMAIKLVPGGHPWHALGEAAANAAREGNFAAGEIERIVVSRPGLPALTGPIHPRDLVEMAHSPAYFVAAGAADREFSWMHASAEKIADPVIHSLIDKITVSAPPTEDLNRFRQGATVSIEAKDGRRSTSTVHVPKGAGMLGVAWEDVDAKVFALMPSSGLGRDRIEEILEAIHRLRTIRDLSGFTALLAGSQT